MDDTSIPIIEKKPETPEFKLELPALFQATIYFINGKCKVAPFNFAMPPGVYPGTWLPKLVEDASKTALQQLKVASRDITWRKPTPAEFVKITAPGQQLNLNKEWQEPYSVELE